MQTFLTIQAPAEGLYKEKASKFIGYAFPVRTEDEVKACLDEVKKLHFKARHVCYAFRLGADKKTYRYSDAGEPPNSAGPPVYGQIKSHDLTNILLVVVRYFGGTKLGVGGLINAYRMAAEDTLKNSILVEDYERAGIALSLPYTALNEVMNFIKVKDVTLLRQEFEEDIKLWLEVPVERKAQTLKELSGIKDVKIQ